MVKKLRYTVLIKEENNNWDLQKLGKHNTIKASVTEATWLSGERVFDIKLWL